MPPPTAESVLEALPPQRLIELGQQLDVALTGNNPSHHIRSLLDSPVGGISRLLGLLRRDEMKHACEAHGIHVKGRLRADLLAKLQDVVGGATVSDLSKHAGRISIPAPGDVVALRRRQYLVVQVLPSANPNHDTLVSLVGLDDDNQGRRLQVFWELELGARVISEHTGSFGTVDHIDPPSHFAAYLNALRWNSVSATDPTLFQAPFRAGIKIMPHQLTALKKALELPRANLFIADDVGLGKTIEAGLVLQELILRQRVDFVLIVCPASVCLQWRDEMANRFGIQCEIYNRNFVSRRRQERGFGINPWNTHTRFIISHQTLRQAAYRDPLLDTLNHGRAHKSLLILDEAHVAAPASESRYAVDSRITKMVRDIAPRFKNRLFLSATPHNGHSNSFSALLEFMDPQRFVRGVPVRGKAALDPVMVRRLKSDLKRLGHGEGYPERKVVQIDLVHENGQWRHGKDLLGEGDATELTLARLLADYTKLVAPARGKGRLVFVNLQKRLLSSAEAFSTTLQVHLDHIAKEARSNNVKHTYSENNGDIEVEDEDDELGPDDQMLSDAEQQANAEATLCLPGLIYYAFFENEVEPAMKLVQRVLDDKARTVLLAMPMQAGKTGTAACVFYLLRALIPDLSGVLICANDQTDLRAQSVERLQHIPGLQVLSRTQRKTWEAYAGKCVIVFFDESHFGDGVGMTINDFLERNGIKDSEFFLFCGISATPFTSMDTLDAEVWASSKNLESNGYNSVGVMLRRKRIVEADELLVASEYDPDDVSVNTKSKVYKHLKRCALAPFPNGFCLIRLNGEHARVLREHLEAAFGERVYVQDWNMRTKGFSPVSYFSSPKRGRFVVVIVQQMARMGNTINTAHFAFMYEFSKTPKIDTIMQSFIGRACGFGKQDHQAVVYSSVAMAEAYDMLMNSNGEPNKIEEFAEFCRANKLRAPKRASFSRRVVEYDTRLVATLQLHGRTKLENIDVEIQRIIEDAGLAWKDGSVRTLSKTYLGKSKRNRSAYNPTSNDDSLFCGVHPGDWSAVVYNKYHDDDWNEGLRKHWTGTIVKIAVRTDEPLEVQSSVGPTLKSLHSTMRKRRAG